MAKEIFLVNPAKRKTAKQKTTKRKKTRATGRKLVARKKPSQVVTVTPRRIYRRNPINKANFKGIIGDAMNAVVMAGGAIGVDILTTKLPIPDQYKNGQYAPLVRAAVAIGSGLILDQLKMKSIAKQVTEGSLVVIAHDTLTKYFGDRVGLSAYEEMQGIGAYADLSSYWDNGLLAYEQPDNVVPMASNGNNRVAPTLL